MVFVNLFAAPFGQAMKYASTYELFQRLAKRAGLTARPHMFRHSAITRWRREGKPDHVIMDLAGHVSRQSMDQYTHASDQENATPSTTSGPSERPGRDSRCSSGSVERRPPG
jgi:integrase/recombinase XerD